MKKSIVYLTLPLFMQGISLSVQAADDVNKPNIIIILADDLGYGDLGITGSLQIKTPNIDQLAADGVFCNTAYVSSAVSSPSRAGLITGKNQVTFGYDNNLSTCQPGYDINYLGLPTSEKTIADRLKSSGYATGIVGKWHLGEAEKFHFKNRGFDEYWGYLGGGHNYWTSKPNGKHYDAPIITNLDTDTQIHYLTDDKGDQCAAFINRHKDEPFFLYASFNAPHAPLEAKESDLKKYAYIQDKKRRTYCAMVSCLDDNVGKIMKALKKNKLDKNTLVFFLSDNGGPVGTKTCNVPYRGQKGTLLEGGIHVPYIVHCPSLLPKGKVYEGKVSSLDIAATACSLAGANTEGLEGVDLIPYLLDKEGKEPQRDFMWRFTISAAIREGNYKLVRLPDRIPMLFDLSKDVREENNLVFEKPEIATRLAKKLGNWDVSLPHVLFVEGPQWRKIQLAHYDQPYMKEQPK